MKLWEVLKALDENPNRKFKLSFINRVYTLGTTKTKFCTFYSLTAMNIKGEDISDTITGGFNENFPVDDNNWEEIKQSVTWQEALEAWAFKYKDIRCEFDNLEFVYRHREKTNGDITLESDGDPLEVMEIRHGKWYIEN